MPCSDGGPNYSDYVRADRENKKLRELLCEACGIIDDAKLKSNMGMTLRKWWRKHQREDAERRKREEEKAALKKLAGKALGKLTSEEIEALRVEHGLAFSARPRKK